MTLASLPVDMLQCILLYLPPSSILELGLSSKYFKTVVTGSSFWKLLCKRDFPQYSENDLELFSSFSFAHKILQFEKKVIDFSENIIAQDIKKGDYILVQNLLSWNIDQPKFAEILCKVNFVVLRRTGKLSVVSYAKENTA